MPKSEFYEIVSKDSSDYAPIDLEGALEVVIHSPTGNSYITNDPTDGSPRFRLQPSFPPLVIHSTDGRLFFVSESSTERTLYVWVIRRRD